MTKPTDPKTLGGAVEVGAPAADPLAKLREPFPAHQISKLPKETKQQSAQRKAEQEKGNWPPKCAVCEGYHHRNAVHLDYVGHAALTDRLLDTDPAWFWEPLAFRDGLPAFDPTGGLWIKLTVCGVTRLGYGHAAAKPGQDPGAREKEVIGDALRNAAMRFGAALDLWHKGDLHGPDEADDPDHDERARPARSEARKGEKPLCPALKAAKPTIDAIPSIAEVKSWEANNEAILSKLDNEQYVEVMAYLRAHEAKLLASVGGGSSFGDIDEAADMIGRAA